MRPTPEQKQQFQQMAQDILQGLGEVPHQDLVLRMLASVLRVSQDDRRADLKLTASTLEEMERAFDTLELYADRRKVSIFGSARTPAEDPIYLQAQEFAEKIASRGFMVITGAGPGVMEAGNRGAGRERSFGMNITLPFEAVANPYIANDPKLLEFRYFFTRKLALVKDSHATVLCPGGFGTMDEGFEVLTLIQTGKSQPMPVILLHPPGSGFWDEWNDYVQGALVKYRMINRDDLSLFSITDSADQAVEEICRFYRRYHSMRFHQGDLILRLASPLSPAELESLNQDFADLLKSGRIEPCSPPEEAAYDAHLRQLPHLRMSFVQGRQGRLRQLIDRINQGVPADGLIPPERGEGGRLHVETDRPSAAQELPASDRTQADA